MMGGPRDYSDVKAGTWAHEAVEYCKNGEVKSVSKDGHEIATFAGGCFWGVELLYQRMPGVIGTAVGYAQGKVDHPSYEAVCSGSTGHTEVVNPLLLHLSLSLSLSNILSWFEDAFSHASHVTSCETFLNKPPEKRISLLAKKQQGRKSSVKHTTPYPH
jgi:methionine-S-sulfoxide reductase